MSSPRHARVTEIFLEACKLEPEEREPFLDEACAGDADLRREVESLLRHDGGDLLQTGGGAVLAASMLARDDGMLCCSDCGKPIAAGEKECSHCGSTVTTVVEKPPEIPGYEILRLLGQGGMGTVYLAEDRTLGRQVALKIVSERPGADGVASQRFIREARTMATVEHPNIVRVYSFGEVEGRQYLVMEYVEGESLAMHIKRLGRLGISESLRILSEALSALAAAWDAGIVHRDVKPANILLDRQERVRVADFGLAKTARMETDSSITHAGQVIGTPHYLSPEQARGECVLDFRSDVYSLGTVLYEMLAGEPPFRGATPISVVDQHLHAPLPSLRARREEIPGEVEQLCEWMVRKRPEDRPASYEELRQSVRALLGERTEAGTAAPSLPSFLLPDAEGKSAAPLFVGRRRELDRLRAWLQAALSGEGRVAMVTGEAGSGKTATITEFARRAQQEHEELIVAVGTCEAQTGVGDPYLPFREVLSLLTADVEFRRASGEIHREHARRLWSLLPLAVEALLDHGPDLLGTFVSGEALVARAAAFTPSPARWRVRLEEQVRRGAVMPRDAGLQQSYLFEQYARTLNALAHKHPLLLQLDDLQWADGGSCGLLFQLARRIAHGRILIVGAFRPAEIDLERDGKRHPMGPVLRELQRRFGDLEVHVGEEETREFVDQLLDSEPNGLGEEFRDRLYDQTRGHPLFTIELLRSMQERGMLVRDQEERWVEGPAMNWEILPARVEGAIGERVARVPDELRKALVLASVQGEEFVAEVLAQLLGSGTRETIALLSTEADRRHRLVVAQGTRRMDGQRISIYRFRHNLFQIYLYGQMDETERAYAHEDVGNALESIYAENADEIAHQLARHFQEASILPKAIDYLRRAGERATRLSANEEAIEHLRRALRANETQPDNEERASRELALQLALGPPLLCTAGPGSEELARAYKRARELCDRVGTAPQLFQTLLMLVHHHANQGRGEVALELAEQLLEVVERDEAPLPAVLAYWARAFSLFYIGRLGESLRDHERVISLYDLERDSTLAYIFGFDPAVSSLAMGGLTLWTLGHLDRGTEYMRRGIAYARDVDHPTSLTHAMVQSAYLCMIGGDRELRIEQADELFRLSTEHGIALFRAWGILHQGWNLAEQGRLEAAIARMHEGIADARTAGSELGHPVAFWCLADINRRAGKLEEALERIADGLAITERTADRVHEAELHRSKGELLLERNAEAVEEAEACFRRAIEISRGQEARSWELRATVSLGRLLRTRDRPNEARAMLAAIYGSFTEGLDTPDLKEAKALLDELS